MNQIDENGKMAVDPFKTSLFIRILIVSVGFGLIVGTQYIYRVKELSVLP